MLFYDTETSPKSGQGRVKKSALFLRGGKKKSKGNDKSFRRETEVGQLKVASSRGFRSNLADEGIAAVTKSEEVTEMESESKLDEATTVNSKAADKEGSTSCSESESGTDSSNESRESDDDGGVDGDGGKDSKSGKQDITYKAKTTKRRRYILFLGNLPTAISRDEVISHFKKRGVPISEFRLLTHKDSGKSKGCGFMELSSGAAMQNALKFHRSRLLGKHINVEVTCGGGGKGEERKKRIQDKNRKLRLEKAVANPVKHNVS